MYLGHPLSANRICLYLFLENESPVWIYFAKEPGDDGNIAICKIEDDSGKPCNVEVKMRVKSYMAIIRYHLKKCHNEAYLYIKAEDEKRKKQKGVGTSDEAQEAQKSNILISLLLKTV